MISLYGVSKRKWFTTCCKKTAATPVRVSSSTQRSQRGLTQLGLHNRLAVSGLLILKVIFIICVFYLDFTLFLLYCFVQCKTLWIRYILYFLILPNRDVSSRLTLKPIWFYFKNIKHRYELIKTIKYTIFLPKTLCLFEICSFPVFNFPIIWLHKQISIIHFYFLVPSMA